MTRTNPDHPTVTTDAYAPPRKQAIDHTTDLLHSQKAVRLDSFDEQPNLVRVRRDHQDRSRSARRKPSEQVTERIDLE
jgi:hypothetical protein